MITKAMGVEFASELPAGPNTSSPRISVMSGQLLEEERTLEPHAVGADAPLSLVAAYKFPCEVLTLHVQ